MTSQSLLAGLATEETAVAVLQKTTDIVTAVAGGGSPTAAQIATAIQGIQPNDYALQSTLAAILQKLIVTPATDTSVQAVVTSLNTGIAHTDAQQIVSGLAGLGTQTTLAAILAKLPSVPATDAPHSTTAPSTVVAGSGLTASQTASDAQLLAALLQVIGTSAGLPHVDQAALLTAVQALGTQTTSAAILAKLSSDPATQTTLAAVLAKLPAAPALDASVTALATLLGLGASGFAKIEDSASAAGDRGVAGLMKRGLTTPTADVDAPGDYLTPMADLEGKQVVLQGSIPDLSFQGYGVITAAATNLALAPARGTGIRNYLRTLIVSASQPTTGVAHIVTILDGATVIHRQQIPASVQTNAITFDPPLRGSAATALNAQISAANSAGTAVTASGYQGL